MQRDTTFEVDTRTATLTMRRPGDASNPSNAFRTAMAVMTGYLAGWDREAPPPEGVIDPRVSARAYLINESAATWPTS